MTECALNTYHLPGNTDQVVGIKAKCLIIYFALKAMHTAVIFHDTVWKVFELQMSRN